MSPGLKPHFRIFPPHDVPIPGIWEHKLKQIEQGQYDAKQFISEIVSFTTEVIEQLKHAEIHVEQAPRGK